MPMKGNAPSNTKPAAERTMPADSAVYPMFTCRNWGTSTVVANDMPPTTNIIMLEVAKLKFSNSLTSTMGLF